MSQIEEEYGKLDFRRFKSAQKGVRAAVRNMKTAYSKYMRANSHADNDCHILRI